MKHESLIYINLAVLIASVIMLIVIGFFNTIPLDGGNVHLTTEEKAPLMAFFIIVTPLSTITFILLLISK